MHDFFKDERLAADFTAIKNLLPRDMSPQRMIEWYVRPVPGTGGKNPLDLICEGRTVELNPYIEELHKTFWQRMRDKFLQ